MDELQNALVAEERVGPRSSQLSRKLNRTLSHHVGLPTNSLHFGILLMACLVGVVQYGIVTVFGLVVDDLESYYKLSSGAGNQLYDTVQMGSCVLCFLPGWCYDRFGAVPTILIGTLMGVVPIFAELDWSRIIPELDTMAGLRVSFFLFGLSASFFQIIAVVAPLEAFPEAHLGKVSAIVQVSTSLGITIQSQVYAIMQKTFVDFVQAYYVYMALSTLIVGIFMAIVFWEDSDLLHRSKADSLEEDGSPSPVRKEPTAAQVPFWRTILSVDFLYMSFVYCGTASFIYTYRDASGQMNSAVGIPASRGMFDWGIYGAIGRVGGNLLLDRTRSHPFGGPLVYVAGSSLLFTLGLLCVVLPSAPGAPAVDVLNFLAGVANGVFFGITAPALRLLFGSGNLGLIYGIMYVWVAVGMPFWTKEMPDTALCPGVTCFRSYCALGAAAFLITALFGMLLTCRRK